MTLSVPNTGAELVTIIRIDWGGDSTHYYADRDITIAGITAKGRISSLGDITHTKSADGLSAVGNASVTLLDADEELLTLQQSKLLDFSPAWIYEAVVGQDELATLLIGEVGSPVTWAEDGHTLQVDIVTSVESNPIEPDKTEGSENNIPICFGEPRLVAPALVERGENSEQEKFEVYVNSGRGVQVYIGIAWIAVPLVGYWLKLTWSRPPGYKSRNPDTEETERISYHQIRKQFGRRLWLAENLIDPWTGRVAELAPRGETEIYAQDMTKEAYDPEDIPEDDDSTLPTDPAKVQYWSGEHYKIDAYGGGAASVGSIWGKVEDRVGAFSGFYWTPETGGFWCLVDIGGRPSAIKWDGSISCNVNAGERNAGLLMADILTNYTNLTPQGDWEISGVNVDFSIVEDTDALTLCQKIAEQTGHAIQITGQDAELVNIGIERAEVVTITDSEILEDSLSITSTTTDSIASAYHGTYREGQAAKQKTKTVRPGAFPTIKREDTIDFPYYKFGEYVDWALAWIANRKGRAWKIAKFRTPLFRFDVSVFDAIRLETDQFDFSPTYGVVESITYNTNDLTISWKIWLPIEQGSNVESENAWIGSVPSEPDPEPYPWDETNYYDILEVEIEEKREAIPAIATGEITEDGAITVDVHGNGLEAEPTARKAVIPTEGPKDWQAIVAGEDIPFIPEFPEGSILSFNDSYSGSYIIGEKHQLIKVKESGGIDAGASGLVILCDTDGAEIGDEFTAKNLGTTKAEENDNIILGLDKFPEGTTPDRERFFFINRGGAAPAGYGGIVNLNLSCGGTVVWELGGKAEYFYSDFAEFGQTINFGSLDLFALDCYLDFQAGENGSSSMKPFWEFYNGESYVFTLAYATFTMSINRFLINKNPPHEGVADRLRLKVRLETPGLPLFPPSLTGEFSCDYMTWGIGVAPSYWVNNWWP